ncbi:NAD-dependent epimerase/dehydratase family protein [Rubrivirga sp.]|uniref:NAD-dependent epimerase/dehydratase family protein n=1 Tax=Rubrivirga sp. TaxID=1885344 RepID=UPI003C73DCD2
MIVVTGATGFVGSVLVRQLVEDGQEVRILRRASSSLDLLGDLEPSGRRSQVEHVVGDVTDPDVVFPALEGAETVYHVAGYVGFGRRARPMLRHVNVQGTATIVNAALEGGVRRLVHTSSIAALGRPLRFTGVLDETSPWRDSTANTHYAISKRDADLEVARGVAEGLDAVTVMPAVVFGPGRRGDGTMAIVERAASGLVAAPPGGTAVVDVEDVARGMRLAAEHGVTGERYILAAENRLWTDLLGVIADAAGTRRPRSVPPWTLLGAGWASQAWAAVTGSDPALSVAQARGSVGTYRYDGSRATRDLGLTYRPFEDTARRAVAALEDDPTRQA